MKLENIIELVNINDIVLFRYSDKYCQVYNISIMVGKVKLISEKGINIKTKESGTIFVKWQNVKKIIKGKNGEVINF